MAKGFNPMQQVKALQEKMAKIHEELVVMTVEATAGGGVVTVVMNGREEVVSIQLEPHVVDARAGGMLQDRMVAAGHAAWRNYRALAAGEMGKLDGGLNIPGLKIPGLF